MKTEQSDKKKNAHFIGCLSVKAVRLSNNCKTGLCIAELKVSFKNVLQHNITLPSYSYVYVT